jgi:CheY-like chemotaxis protein
VTTAGTLNILLIEDDELQQLNVRRALEKADITCPLWVASDGAEALELLRSGRVPPRRLILLDVHMPRMDGLEFLRQLRADPVLKSMVVVMLSTSDEEPDKREAQALNVGGYLLKSKDFAKFVGQLRLLNQYWSMMEIP